MAEKSKEIIKELNSQLLKKDFKKIYLFYGQEIFLIDEYTRRFSYAIVGGNLNNIVKFDGETANYNDIINEMFSISFDLEPKVLIFKNFFKYASTNSSLNLSAIIDNLKNFKSDSTYIIFKEYEAKENKFFSALKQIAYSAEFVQPSMPDLVKWVQNVMSKEGKAISENMAQEIILHYNKDMMLIYNHLQVLISYLGKRSKVTHDDILKTLTDNPQDHIFQMLDAFATKDTEGGYKYLRELYQLRTSVSKILALILRHFKILGMLKEMQETNKKQIAKQLGILEFFVDKYKKQAESLTLDKIKSIIQKTIEYEYMIKKGQIDDETALEMLLYQIVK
ncbi:DNA polymerase III, delta subunit [Caldicellulosiruptor obsidiansis OB47]|uniref:DNA polymerase III subunit delta n=1 Tax=Caldicellulosiruptor obsidiansis (strain ATCC BAA-2073 / JCM 16842 / OB47) TaxID=608506 RepID=D9TFN7_CALOO|nr:DNA polymerase III subunit delta [Caldicellulosiruptor obsidiansis]ADL43007.1 DNA polymerase III, delta subunit [Caldicellulosiruptor obsidiansis OB47]